MVVPWLICAVIGFSSGPNRNRYISGWLSIRIDHIGLRSDNRIARWNTIQVSRSTLPG